MDRRKQARQLLTHYLTLIADKAGVKLGPDCYVEIGEITDMIFDEIEARDDALNSRIEALDRHIGKLGTRVPAHDNDTHIW